ncbi:MAG: DUF421 domain-containing protein [Actinobacteria bacterium]|nr:DUF421 domain-containing protein [Actinomycetota bacterium]
MDIVIRAAVAYVFIVFVMRVIGRRELSTLGPTDLVLLVVMGDLIQNGVTQSDMSVTGVMIAVSTFAVLTVASSYLTFRSTRASKVLEGEPLILVEDGRAIERNLRSERMTVDDVLEEARAQNIERLDQIRWAVLESGGTISFIRTSNR